jgi:sporulation protein YlmC with PRC-barrel domain
MGNPRQFQIFELQQERVMKRSIAMAATVSAMLLSSISLSQAQQVVGSTQLGVAVAELRDVTVGWSAKRQILGQPIYNDKGEAIGKADDIIIAPDKAVSYAIIGAGGFLGVGKHDVAIPVSQLKESDGKIVLAGATRDAVKAMPAFEYAR